MNRRFAILIIGLASLLLCGPGGHMGIFAQEKTEPWEIQFAYSPKEKPILDPRIALRPNAAQAIFLHLKNPSPVAKKNLSLALVRTAPDGKSQVLAEAVIDKIAGSQLAAIKWKPVQLPKDQLPKDQQPKDQPPIKDKEDAGEVKFFSMPSLFQIWLKEGNKEVVKLDLP